MITVTTVVEHVFCSRFTYFGHVLGLQQYEQKRGTVISGKKHHKSSETTNIKYVPTDMSGNKVTSAKLYSKRHGFVGIVDHCVISDDKITLIERKYSTYTHLHDTVLVQIGLLAVLLEENLGLPVKDAIIIFSKDGSRNQVKVDVNSNLCNFALLALEDTKRVIQGNKPSDSSFDARCINCCYRKVCDVGSLNNN